MGNRWWFLRRKEPATPYGHPAARHIDPQTGAICRDHFAVNLLEDMRGSGLGRKVIDRNGNFVMGTPNVAPVQHRDQKRARRGVIEMASEHFLPEWEQEFIALQHRLALSRARVHARALSPYYLGLNTCTRTYCLFLSLPSTPLLHTLLPQSHTNLSARCTSRAQTRTLNPEPSRTRTSVQTTHAAHARTYTALNKEEQVS